MVDEIITKKVEAYNLTPYKDEIRQFVVANKEQLDNFSNMVTTYNELYKSIFLGSEEAKTERFPQAAETYKVYKAALIEACLSGYSAALQSGITNQDDTKFTLVSGKEVNFFDNDTYVNKLLSTSTSSIIKEIPCFI